MPFSPTGAPELARILAPIADDMRRVDGVIRERLRSDIALIGTIGEYIIGGGGKRLRPAVLLLIARALGYRGTAHTQLAAVIEFIHTATLLHDDVVDESDLRRGRATSNAMFGNAASVLVGDFLYSRSFQMMVDAGSMRVMRILADATNRIAEGEVLQLMNVHDPSVDEARYLMVVERKTATLFEAAARIGAVLAGADPSTEAACARYGASLGTAFQMIDDVL
ncbi:MAG: polyprenyl synthetase family protein, partial [Pseudomonadota bacterium]